MSCKTATFWGYLLCVCVCVCVCVWGGGGVTGLLASEAICIKCTVHSITDLEGPEV